MHDETYPEDEPLTMDEAWAVGLFEGEGCMTISGTRYPHARLKLNSTDEDVVRRFHGVVGIGNVRIDHAQEKHGYKTQWEWYAGAKADVVAFLLRFIHHFSARRHQRAFELLLHCERR
jgi:hypothetical protein